MSRSLLCWLLLAGAAPAAPKLDRYGDPLPEGAITRFGTVRYRVGSPWSFALSPDGKTLATEDHLGVTLWDIETGRPTKIMPVAVRAGENPRFGLCYSPDGRYLARLAGRFVCLIDTTTGKERFSHDLENRKGRSVACAPGAKQLVVTSDEPPGAIYLDAETGGVVRTVKTEAGLSSLSPSGRFLLTSWAFGPQLVEATTGRIRRRFPKAILGFHDGMALSPDERRLYVMRDTGQLQTFDVVTGKLIEELTQPADWQGGVDNVSLSFSLDGAVLYVGGRKQPVQRRDLKAGRWLKPLPGSFGGPILPLPGGKRVVQLGQEGVLRTYDLATLRQLPLPEGFEYWFDAHPSPGGARVIARVLTPNPRETCFEMFDDSGRRLWSIQAGFFAIPFWSPDGRQVLSSAYERLCLLDPLTGKAARAMEAGEDLYKQVFFCKDSQRAVFIGLEGAVATYDLGTGKRRSLTQTHISDSAADLSPDDRTLLFNSRTEGIALLDLPSGKVRVGWTDRPKKDRPHWLGQAVFSPDGSYVLSWEAAAGPSKGENAVAVMRDPRTLTRMRSFKTDLRDDYTLALSADGQWLAVGDQAGDLHLWDVATGNKIGTWTGHRRSITNVAFVGLGRALDQFRRPNRPPLGPTPEREADQAPLGRPLRQRRG